MVATVEQTFKTKILVELISPRQGTKNVELIAQEINFYESIETPYVTGNIVITDSSNLSNAAAMIGQEDIKITVKRQTDKGSGETIIQKELSVISIQKTNKLNDSTSVYILNFIDKFAARDKIIRWSKKYESKPDAMISTILNEKLGVRTTARSSAIQNNMRVLVPFTYSPMNIAEWLTARCTTGQGAPFYIFSHLKKNNEVELVDLQTLLTQGALNSGNPFKYSSAMGAGKELQAQQPFRILTYETNVESTIKAINGASYGAQYHWLDLYKDGAKEDRYKITDVLSTLNMSSQPAAPYNYDPGYSLAPPYHEGVSTYTSQIVTRKIFDDGTFSYNEEANFEPHMRKAESKGLFNFAPKESIIAQVPAEFFDNQNEIVGRVINLEFPKNIFVEKEAASSQKMKDKKKSGNWLVYSTRHIISNRNYTITMTCLKTGTDASIGQEQLNAP